MHLGSGVFWGFRGLEEGLRVQRLRCAEVLGGVGKK